MENIFIDVLPPWVETGLQPAFYDKESGTVLQQVSRMYYKMNELIKAQNIEIEKFNELYTYVHDYFDDLDVQEEINNKLDEMAQSGELEAILQQILNTLRVYDTVSDMIEDEAIQNGQRVLCYGYSTKTDNGGGFYTITNDELTANGLTIIELDNGLFAVKEYTDSIVVADQSALTPALITELLNNSTQIITTSPIEVTETIYITQEGATIRDMEFVGNTTNEEYVLRIEAPNVTISGCKFSGDTGNYLRIVSPSNFVTVENNIFDGSDGSTISPLVLWGVDGVKVHGNTFLNNYGFNTQLIKCKNCIINDNIYHNDFYEGSITTAGGETVLQYNTMGIKPTRKSLRIDGEFTTDYTIVYDEETSIATLTLNSAIQGVKTVIFRCYSSLEMININSHCNNITVTSNTLDGTGDSGIVIGRDYHENVLNPSASVLSDSPINIEISSNTITNCLYAGIATTHVCPKIAIHDNIISNYGWGQDGVYSSGVFIATAVGVYGISVCNNTFSNSSTSMYGETENGIGKYGVTINPFADPSDTTAYDAYMKSPNRFKVLDNTSDGSVQLIKVFPFSTLSPQVGYIVTPAKVADLGVRANQTTADGDYNAIGTMGCGASVTTDSGTSVINIDFNESGSRYCSMDNTTLKIARNANVHFSFWAKSDVENEGDFRVYYIQNSSTKTGAIMKITNEWKYYDFCMLLGDFATSRTFSPRFLPSGTCRNIKFKDFHITLEYFD